MRNNKKQKRCNYDSGRATLIDRNKLRAKEKEHATILKAMQKLREKEEHEMTVGDYETFISDIDY